MAPSSIGMFTLRTMAEHRQGCKQMSLVIARAATDGVILAADTRLTGEVDGMNYIQPDCSKTYLYGGNCAVGITGQVKFMIEFLEDAERHDELKFSEKEVPVQTVTRLTWHFHELFKKRFPKGQKSIPYPTTLTFAGHGNFGEQSGAFMYELSLKEGFGAMPKERFTVSGQKLHGGAYYLHRFREVPMDMETAAFLSFFCIKEVAEQDLTVGMPVEIITVANGVAQSMSSERLLKFEERRTKCFSQMQSWFTTP